MEYKNQTENRAFQEMLQAAVKRLQNRSGEEIAAKSGAVFHSSRNVLEIMSFYETIEIQLPEFYINSDIDEWHYLTLLHYLDMADGTEGSQQLITFGNLKDGLIRGTKFDRTAEQKLEKLLQDKDPEKIQKACKNLGAEFTETKADLCAVFPVLPRYPVTLKIWFADEEFPVSGKIFLVCLKHPKFSTVLFNVLINCTFFNALMIVNNIITTIMEIKRKVNTVMKLMAKENL